MIICGILADSDVDWMLLSLVIEHGRRQIRVNFCIRAQLDQMAEIDEIVRSQVGVDFADDETIPCQGQRHFKSIAVLHLANGNRRAAVFFPYSLDNSLCPFMPGTVINFCIQYLRQGLVLLMNLSDLLKPGQLDTGNPQALFHILGSQARFRIEDQIDISLGHGLIGRKIGTA